MPVGAAISAAGGILGNVINWFSQKSENKKNREWSEHMYEKQHADQIADWNMMNEYNAPSAQMERLTQSGLNPHLVYGSGSAATTTGQVPSGSFPSNSQRAPQLDLSQFNMMGQYLQLRQMESNIEHQNLVNQYLKDANPLEIQSKQLDNILKGYQKEITQNNLEVSDMNLEKERDAYNTLQLITHGLDGNFKFSRDMSEDARSRYLSDLEESDLYNSIKGVMEAKSLTPQIMRKKLDILQGEVSRLPLLFRKYQADVAVAEFKARLAQMDMNPDDPLWLRLLVDFIGPKEIKSTANTLKKHAQAMGGSALLLPTILMREFFGNGK